MQTDRSTMKAFIRSMRTQNEHAAVAKVEPMPAVQTVEHTALGAQPVQNDRTSLRVALDRMAEGRERFG